MQFSLCYSCSMVLGIIIFLENINIKRTITIGETIVEDADVRVRVTLARRARLAAIMLKMMWWRHRLSC